MYSRYENLNILMWGKENTAEQWNFRLPSSYFMDCYLLLEALNKKKLHKHFRRVGQMDPLSFDTIHLIYMIFGTYAVMSFLFTSIMHNHMVFNWFPFQP